VKNRIAALIISNEKSCHCDALLVSSVVSMPTTERRAILILDF